MRSSISTRKHWAVPHKVLKVLHEEAIQSPKIFFLKKYSEQNLRRIESDISTFKVVLIGVFDE